MGIGDVVSAIALTPTNAYLVYLPDAGIEARIEGVGSGSHTSAPPDRTPDADVYLYDGTNQSLMWVATNATMYGRVPIWVNNALYLRCQNKGGSSEYLSFNGIQTR